MTYFDLSRHLTSTRVNLVHQNVDLTNNMQGSAPYLAKLIYK